LRTHVDDDQSKSVIQVLEHFHAVDQAAFGMVLGNDVKSAVKKFKESYHRHQDEFHGGKKVTGTNAPLGAIRNGNGKATGSV